MKGLYPIPPPIITGDGAIITDGAAGAAWITVVLLMVVVWLGREGGALLMGALLMDEAEERPPERPPLRPARRELVGPKSAPTSGDASAASGVSTFASINEAANMDDPITLAAPSVDIRSSVDAFEVEVGANAAEGAIDIAATATAKADTLTILNLFCY